MIRSLYKRSLIISSYHYRIKSNLFVYFQIHATTHKRIVMNIWQVATSPIFCSFDQIFLCEIWDSYTFVGLDSSHFSLTQYRQHLNCTVSDCLTYHCMWRTFIHLQLPWLRFFRAFSSVVRQMPGCNSQRLGTANTLPNLLFVLFCLLFMLFCC
jgi:hypothetical protein